MSLPMLPPQRMLLITILLIHPLVLPALGAMSLHMVVVDLQSLLVQFAEFLHRDSEITNQRIAPTLREILPHNYPHHPHPLRMRRHSISRDDPSSLPQLVRDGKLIKFMSMVRVQTESYKRQAFAASLGHEDEAHFLDGEGQVVRRPGQVAHNAAVALFAEANELVVLRYDLGGAAGEVEGEGGLVCAEVVYVEDELYPNKSTRWSSNNECLLMNTDL